MIMKTTLLLITGLLMSITTLNASENHSDKIDITKQYRYAQPIVFVERGVEFGVFPDGSFDFNTNYNDPYNNASRRTSINVSYNGPRVSVSYSSAIRNRTYISRDRNGIVSSVWKSNTNRFFFY